MEPETKAKIEETVREILGKSDMSKTTVNQIRKQASDKLGLDLSQTECKDFVRHVVNSVLEEQEDKSKQQEEEVVEEEGKGNREYDDQGDLIVCKLSDMRRVTIQDFKGKSLISIREYFIKDGKEFPSSRGISLTEDQWSIFKTHVPDIEKAVQKMESRIQ
ncbi:hypothetical protein Dsin_007979 [Dipteronia sinensis]|uniref:DEK-C domain-containing protein n=1 Tax=Dipteronia sinensis TaxID=43782 RepID=A0AAE0B2I1_9ROSI|nr:hypothetical protein Dsin_007979 [Dipteronia sinensis]